MLTMSKISVASSPLVHMSRIMQYENNMKNFLHLRSTIVCKVRGLVDHGSFCQLFPYLTFACASEQMSVIVEKPLGKRETRAKVPTVADQKRDEPSKAKV
jgi:hypothetical protein